jgi:uncharacterized protein YbaA (DUF1428 family)
MARYIDGFVVPVPRRKVAAYRRMAQQAARVWQDHGALEYKECLLDDPASTFALPFPKGIKAKAGETVVFSWIAYKSRAHRDRVNTRVMKDPRLAAMCDPQDMPFDCKRMLYGGFKTIVES